MSDKKERPPGTGGQHPEGTVKGNDLYEDIRLEFISLYGQTLYHDKMKCNSGTRSVSIDILEELVYRS